MKYKDWLDVWFANYGMGTSKHSKIKREMRR